MAESPSNKKRKGLILKETRESKGIDLMSVHEVTKIPMDVLRAIEEGYQVRTLSPFYVKGFMKMYAQYLGVNISDIIEDYHQEVLPPPVSERKPDPKPAPPIKEIIPQDKQQRIFKVIGVVFILFLVGRMVGCMINKKKSPEQKKESVKAEEKKNTEKASKETKPEAVTPSKKEEAKPPAAPSQQPKSQAAALKVKQPVKKVKAVNLTIRSKQKVWLQVKVDGNVVFQSTLQKGNTETWQADDVIELSGRNISNLEFELNGKLLGRLGRADRKARRVEISKDGLTVKQ